MSAEITRVIVDTTQGFKHFSLYLRGREELLVTVFHGNDVDVGGGGSGRRGSEAMDTICESSPSDIHSRPSSVQDTSPRARPIKTVQSNVLVPASPASREAVNESPTETVFLVGAYAKYNWPYVWLRSNHLSRSGGRLGSVFSGPPGGSPGEGGAANDTRDLPLDLITTQRWELGKHRVWDIVEELVNMNVFPNPANPFAVDHAALRRLPAVERFLTTGAMVSFLRDLLGDNSDSANNRMGLRNDASKHAGGDDKKVEKRSAGLSLSGVSGGGGGQFVSAVETDLNKLVLMHLAAMPADLLKGFK